MRCKHCRRKIEDNSIFCNWCGAKQIREEAEISVPRPRMLKSGLYTAQLMVAGKRYTVTEDSEAKYYAKARSLKVGLIEMVNKPVRYSLKDILDIYIERNTKILSPSTLRGYSYIRKGRFQGYMSQYVDSIDWQKMLNEEAAICAEKTLKNAWGLVAASLKALSLPVPDVNLPMVPRRELPWLNYQQIQTLIDGARGTRTELPVILALHSLRLSELLALTVDDICQETIHVRRSAVFGEDNRLVIKDKGKTSGSARDVPVLIPRLLELLPESGTIVSQHPNSLRRSINSLCRSLGLPEVGVHGLRRSFASLGYHLGWSERSIMAVGGWSNYITVHSIYIKLSKNDIDADAKRMRDFYEFTDGGV